MLAAYLICIVYYAMVNIRNLKQNIAERVSSLSLKDGVIIVFSLWLLFGLFADNSMIAGLDNALPIAEPAIIISKLSGAGLFQYGGSVAISIMFYPFLLIGLTSAFISRLFIVSALWMGVVGLSRVLELVNREKTNGGIAILWVVTGLLLAWLISHPSVLFVSSFATLPWLVLAMIGFQKSRSDIFMIVLAVFFLLATTLNSVMFISLVLQAVLLAIVINQRTLGGTKSSKSVWKRPFMVLIAVLVTTFLYYLGLSFFEDGTLLSSASEYVGAISGDGQVVKNVGESIGLSESQNNISRSLRYAVSWMELHYPDMRPVFNSFETYRNNPLYIFWGLLINLPLLAYAGYAMFFTKNTYRRSIGVIYVLSIFFISKYAHFIFSSVNGLDDILRWSSSKFWPMMLLSGILIWNEIEMLMDDLSPMFAKAIKITTVLLLSLYALPFLIGGPINSELSFEMPSDYQVMSEYLESSEVDGYVLTMPSPQLSYFREYEWGYYGGDFLNQILHNTVIDLSSAHIYGENYVAAVKMAEECKLPSQYDGIIYGAGDELTELNSLIEKCPNYLKAFESPSVYYLKTQ